MLGLLYLIFCAVACYLLGTSKGYSGAICVLAGVVGGLFGIIILAILPDQEDEQATTSAQETAKDREITALKQRVAQLENAQSKLLPTAETIPHQPSAEPEQSAEKGPSSGPVIFPARTHEVIICPRCGKQQWGNRNICCTCGTPFLYENE